MSISVAELHTALHDLFNDTARQLASDTGFCRRQRQLTGPVFAQSVVFSLLHKPDSALEDFADFASENLDVDVSPEAFGQRFTAACADFFQELFAAALDRCFTARPALLPLLRRFEGVYLRDASIVSLPDALAEIFPGRKGKDGLVTAALKLVLEVEVSTGQFTEAEILPALANDKTASISAKPLPAGSLLLEDMGLLAAGRLQAYMDQGVYFLTRVPCWTALFLKNKTGKGFVRFDLRRWLRRAKGWYLERTVYVFHHSKLALRLLAVRVPEEVAQQRRQQAIKEAKQHGRPVSQAKLELCEWNILLSNAPAELLSVFDAWEVRRVRWQVELIFKLFKSEGGLEKTQARKRWRVVAELYAKLLAMLVQQWLLLSAGYVMLWHSARRASRRVRQRAGALVQALGSAARLSRLIDRLGRQLHRCRIRSGDKQLSTFDRLAALDAEFRELLDLAA